MQKIKMVVFDFDGIIVESRWGEKLWRWLAEKMKIKTPSALFLFQELVEIIFDIKLKPIKETAEAIKRLNQNGYDVGILTDRSLWSLCIFFSNNKSVDFRDFNFIQTRKSILNRLVKQLPIDTVFFVSKETKPNFQMFQGLKKFAGEDNIELQEIFVIDDSPQVLELAKTNGFSIAKIKTVENQISFLKNAAIL